MSYLPYHFAATVAVLLFFFRQFIGCNNRDYSRQFAAVWTYAFCFPEVVIIMAIIHIYRRGRI